MKKFPDYKKGDSIIVPLTFEKHCTYIQFLKGKANSFYFILHNRGLGNEEHNRNSEGLIPPLVVFHSQVIELDGQKKFSPQFVNDHLKLTLQSTLLHKKTRLDIYYSKAIWLSQLCKLKEIRDLDEHKDSKKCKEIEEKLKPLPQQTADNCVFASHESVIVNFLSETNLEELNRLENNIIELIFRNLGQQKENVMPPEKKMEEKTSLTSKLEEKHEKVLEEVFKQLETQFNPLQESVEDLKLKVTTLANPLESISPSEQKLAAYECLFDFAMNQCIDYNNLILNYSLNKLKESSQGRFILVRWLVRNAFPKKAHRGNAYS